MGINEKLRGCTFWICNCIWDSKSLEVVKGCFEVKFQFHAKTKLWVSAESWADVRFESVMVSEIRSHWRSLEVVKGPFEVKFSISC